MNALDVGGAAWKSCTAGKGVPIVDTLFAGEKIRMTEVIFSADLGGVGVRFVRSPLPGIDAPWVVAGDMMRAVRLDEDKIARFIGSMRGASPVCSMALLGRIEQIAPPWTLVLLCEQLGMFGAEPRKAVIGALAAAYPDLSPIMRLEVLLECPSATPPIDGEAE
jgi:hypothetical protein